MKRRRPRRFPFHPSSFCLHPSGPGPHPRPLPEYRAREESARSSRPSPLSRRLPRDRRPRLPPDHLPHQHLKPPRGLHHPPHVVDVPHHLPPLLLPRIDLGGRDPPVGLEAVELGPLV